jgi:hypothetical protein
LEVHDLDWVKARRGELDGVDDARGLIVVVGDPLEEGLVRADLDLTDIVAVEAEGDRLASQRRGYVEIPSDAERDAEAIAIGWQRVRTSARLATWRR